MVSLKAFLIVLALGMGLFAALFANEAGSRKDDSVRRIGLGVGLIIVFVALGVAYLAGAL